MHIFKKVEDLQNYIAKERKKGLRVGFVPTMGALHHGHLSLIQQAKLGADICVCSIFVNPTQFNDLKDLEKYPRTTARDIHLLNGVSTEVLFIPPAEEVYPEGLDTTLSLDFSPLDKVLEGEFRPGHFQGMAQVVKRLLDIVRPDQLYMGQKDFQQFSIVQLMLDLLKLDVELVMCPIIREEDGLAMSSRNRRLLPEHRPRAVRLSQTLQAVKSKMDQQSPAELEQWAIQELTIPDFRPEYFRIVDGKTLAAIDNFAAPTHIVACTAVWVGDIRLIDNIILKWP